MKLKNVLIVVNDIERSRKYYHDLFGLEMVLDNDGNMILTEGLVLQDAGGLIATGEGQSHLLRHVGCRYHTWIHSVGEYSVNL